MITSYMRKGLRAKAILASSGVIALLGLLLVSVRLLAGQRPSTLTKIVHADVPSMGQLPYHIATSDCTSHRKDNASLQFAVIVDAGLISSEVHIYRFSMCRDKSQLEEKTVASTNLGILFDNGDLETLSAPLDEIIAAAKSHVPQALQHCTPVSLKVTDAILLLDSNKSDSILRMSRNYLTKRTSFHIKDVGVSSDKDRGIQTWITVNHLADKLTLPRDESYGILDFTGDSAQVVFEPRFLSKKETMPSGDHVHSHVYQGKTSYLYQHTYRNNGVNSARQRLKQTALDRWQQEATWTGKVYHPCLPDGHAERLMSSANNDTIVELLGTGAGYTECRIAIDHLFDKSMACPISPCTFNGVYQPHLSTAMKNREVYTTMAISNLTQPLGMPDEFSLAELGILASRVCNNETTAFLHIPRAIDILTSHPDYCLELAYLHSFLSFGLDMPPEQLLRIAKNVGKMAHISWHLGAAITLLNSGQSCASIQ